MSLRSRNLNKEQRHQSASTKCVTKGSGVVVEIRISESHVILMSRVIAPTFIPGWLIFSAFSALFYVGNAHGASSAVRSEADERVEAASDRTGCHLLAQAAARSKSCCAHSAPAAPGR